MSTITGPFTITPAAPVALTPPQNAQTLGLLVLDNLSGYLLQVQVGPDIRYQAPLVEDAYALLPSYGSTIQVAAIALTGDLETAGQIAPTWYNVGEAPPAASWPIALSGPAEVAAATAAALLAGGVPNVFTQTLIYAGVIAPNGNSGDIDAHTYGSIVVESPSGPVGGYVQWYDKSGIQLGRDYGITISAQGLTLPVRGYYFAVFNTSMSTPLTVNVYGTNRLTPGPSAANAIEGADLWLLASTLMAAGTVYQLAQQDSFVVFQGQTFASFTTSNAAVTGRFEVTPLAVGPAGTAPVVVCDTTEMIAGSAGGKYLSKMIALPVGGYSIAFHCLGTGGTGNAALRMIPGNT